MSAADLLLSRNTLHSVESGGHKPMKNLKFLLPLILFPVLAFGQVHNQTFGKGINGQQYLGVRNDSASTTINDTNGAWGVIAVDSKGQQFCSITSEVPGTAATSLGKAEDAAHASGDTGIAIWGVRNDGAATTFDNASGDYSPLGVGPVGNLFVTPLYDSGTAGALSIIEREDNASGNSDAGAKILVVTQDPLTVDQNANGDYGFAKMDRAGRLITTQAPTGETWQGCGTATASTADVAIKAGVASNRIYVTSITCSNSSAAVASNLNFKDGSTIIAVGGVSQMATASPGSFTAVFPVPLKGTANTAFNFNTAVSVSSVVCCAQGYISVQ